jgi:aldehyde dehydrogenase (NAD+)
MSENISARTGPYVDGTWRDGDAGGITSTSPIDGSVVGEFGAADAGGTREAIDAAVGAQDEWAELTTHDRGTYLREAADEVAAHKEELSRLLTREMGKTIGAARGELQRSIDLLNYYAEVARDAGGDAPPSASQHTLTYTRREPWGTAGIITPWNYPIAIPTWKMAPALIAGNTVVFKPASSTPAIGAELVAALEAAGVPDGVVNFVPGSGSEVGDTIVTDDDVDVVSFTGSYHVGHGVQEAATRAGKRVQCEMGGKNPLLVDDSADLDLAVQLTIDGGVAGLAGQACTATSRAIVFESVYDEYLDRLVSAVEDLTVGDALDEETDMGPKYAAEGLETDLEYIEAGREAGATLVTGGNRLTGGVYDDGYFVEPTVFADVDPEMRIAQEEIFGPVLSVIEVADYDEAIEVANGVDYGLSAALCTNRLDRTQEFADRIDAGVVKINQTSTGVEMQLPFGGRKNSSSETFKEQGRQALDFYTHEKAVYVTHTPE